MSSQSPDPDHLVAPLRYTDSFQEAKSRLLEIIKNIPRTTIIENDAGYIHVECRSLIFRFTDDLEFLFDEKQKIVHVRSASRVGYFDLGVNRNRVEAIRRQFE